jgi:2-keto-3-deoxy-6-phosphogluconate aldolase
VQYIGGSWAAPAKLINQADWDSSGKNANAVSKL